MFGFKRRKRLREIQEKASKLTKEDISKHTLAELEEMCGITEDVDDTNEDRSHGGFYCGEITEKDFDRMQKKYDKVVRKFKDD